MSCLRTTVIGSALWAAAWCASPALGQQPEADGKVAPEIHQLLLTDSDGDLLPNALELPAIVDGGNGVANTVAMGDDVQVVPLDQPVMPGGAVILPGPNGAIDTGPAGDDLLGRVARPGFAQVIVDNLCGIFSPPIPDPPAWDGFLDEPIGGAFAEIPPCVDWTLPDFPRVRTAMNHGKITIVYLMDSDGVVDPNDPNGTDDSLLYVGIDILNGNGEADYADLTGDLGSWRTDFGMFVEGTGFLDLPPGLGYLWLCEYGLPADGDPLPEPGKMKWYMPPFDSDGDGDPDASDWINGITDDDEERYEFRMWTCMGVPDIPCAVPTEGEVLDFELAMNRSTFQLDGPPGLVYGPIARGGRDRHIAPVPTDPNVRLVIDGQGATAPEVARFPHWPPDGTTAVEIKQWADDAFSNQDDPNYAVLDVEFIIPRVDSYILSKSFPGYDYETVRLRLAQSMIRTRSDTLADLSQEDATPIAWFIPIEELEATKSIRCEGDPNWIITSDPNEIATLKATVGAIVEFKLEIENTGNVPLDVTLLDEVRDLCDDANLNPITKAIVDGGNGIADTTAHANDIQVIPPGHPVAAGGVVVLPGPDGLLDSTATADDQAVTTTMTVLLTREADFIVDGGNGAAESTPGGDDVQCSVSAPGDIVISPGPDSVLDSTPGGDDFVATVPLMGEEIDYFNAFCFAFDRNDFFGPIPGHNNQFLIDIRNDVSTHMGTLYGIRGACDDEWIAGDRVEITFKAVVEAAEDFCDVCPDTPEDVENRISAFVDKNSNGLPDVDEPGDLAGAIDTPREIGQGYDDNVVRVNILCNPLGCTKEWGALWDVDASCEPGPRFAIIEPTVGGNGQADTTQSGDDLQVITPPDPADPGDIVVLPEPFGQLDTAPQADDVKASIGWVEYDSCLDLRDKVFPAILALRITGFNNESEPIETTVADPMLVRCVLDTADVSFADVIFEPVDGDGIVNTTAANDDIQIIPLGDAADPGDIIITPGPDGVLDTTPVSDDLRVDVIVEPPGGNGFADTPAAGLDDQIATVGDAVEPGSVIVSAGPDYVLSTTPVNDEIIIPGCEFGQLKDIPGHGSTAWFCYVRVESAEAMRALADCDGEPGEVIIEPLAGGNGFSDTTVAGGSDDDQVINQGLAALPCDIIIRPGLDGVLDTAPGGDDEIVQPFENTATVYAATDVCGSGFASECSAKVLAPPPCELEVTKEVVCVDCNDPNIVISPPAGGDWMEIGEGACARFTIQVTNTSRYVKLPHVCITDDLSDPSWLIPNTCKADIAGDDVTACVCPTFNVNGSEACFTFAACRPGAPWIANHTGVPPGETLTITFVVDPPTILDPVDVVTEPSGGNALADTNVNTFSDDVQILAVGESATPGSVIVAPGPNGVLQTAPDPDDVVKEYDVVNVITAEGYTEACPPEPNESDCEDVAAAALDVLEAEIECLKQVAVDLHDDGTVDAGPAIEVQLGVLEPTDFPLRLIYTYHVTNTGDLRLINGVLCDHILVDAVNATGATFGPCDFDPNGCVDLPPLEPGDSVSKGCEVVIPDEVVWGAFLQADLDGDADCFRNLGEVYAEPNYAEICPPAVPEPVEALCPATVCSSSWCPPGSKAEILMWNENETVFSGTQRCIWRWDSRRISTYTQGTGIPNGFPNLQTSRGVARIDGIALESECPGSIVSPLLGVSKKILDINGDTAFSGTSLVGTGRQEGWFIVSNGAAAPGSGDGMSPAAHPVDGLLPPADEPEGDPIGRAVSNRVDTAKKGSLLVFPMVELKWDAAGQIVQDTFFEITNDIEGGVFVKMLYVNADPPCTVRDTMIELTGNHPAYWSMATGEPGVSLHGVYQTVVPFTILNFPVGAADPDPTNPGGTRLRGYVVAYAANVSHQEVRWNYLAGRATIVRYDTGTAWEHHALTFQAEKAVADGALLDPPIGRLDLNGAEYSWAPNQLLFDFYTPGAVLESAWTSATVVDTELTLLVARVDLTESP